MRNLWSGALLVLSAWVMGCASSGAGDRGSGNADGGAGGGSAAGGQGADTTVGAGGSLFEPDVEWKWSPSGIDGDIGSYHTVAIGNLSDDNNDGSIDLLDTPDIVSLVWTHLYLLSGDTGAELLRFDGELSGFSPALGDIDADGLPDVVAVDDQRRVVAFRHDGALKWTGGQVEAGPSATLGHVALYDLDGDGDVEIIAGYEVFDHTGQRLWGAQNVSAVFDTFLFYEYSSATAADLDGNGVLEVIFGHAAYQADGTPLWQLAGHGPSHPHIANFDDDPELEIVLTSPGGLTLVQHDGTVTWALAAPPEQCPSPFRQWNWMRPGVAVDLDCDGVAELVAAGCTQLFAYDITASGPQPRWSTAIDDPSGAAGATAFDLFGDMRAEIIYHDERHLYIFDGETGQIEMDVERQSGTESEVPVVADVDNDGAAEIIVVQNDSYSSNEPYDGAVTVFGDGNNGWVGARRIWNQHAYHISHVHEDGTIMPPSSWQPHNSFRVNALLDDADICGQQPPN